MVLTVVGIEDEVIWRVFLCIRVVFPAQKALGFFNSNNTSMKKIYCLVYYADCAMRKFPSIQGDECLFGLSSSSALTGCDKELVEDFGE